MKKGRAAALRRKCAESATNTTTTREAFAASLFSWGGRKMDVFCSTCKEPVEADYLWNDAIYETDLKRQKPGWNCRQRESSTSDTGGSLPMPDGNSARVCSTPWM
jgi:hypothetical protein